MLEGKDDGQSEVTIIGVDTYETRGSAIDRMTWNESLPCKSCVGCIVFTDPDYNERIARSS